MRISKLDLYGFKSFPDRTAFQFGSGVSCVVGPNGCGKSNVVDALRWCIGEQSARKLRGGEMMDVIFAGSAERAPVGFAEVMLTLTADSGEPFPGEYAHLEAVQVGRRLHRNGTSEYVINQVTCRRRDIVELFMDTGIGNNLYSFIEQGQVDKMVHASPLERRGIIDEAAGIARYAARRSEAQSRLEATAGQLDRAADVADEMGRRLRVLERQVLKAAKFRRLRALIRQDEILLSLVKYADLSADRRALRQQLRDSEGELAAMRREVDRRQKDLVARREEIAVVDAAASSWRDEVAELDARRRELDGAKAFQEKRRDELIEQIQRALSDVDVASGEEAEEVRIGEAAAAESGAIAAALDGSTSELRSAQEAAASAHVQKRQARDALRAHEGASETVATERVSLQLAVERDTERLAAIPGLERAQRADLETAMNDRDLQRSRRDTARREASDAERRHAELEALLGEAQTRVRDAERRVREAHEQTRTSESELEDLRSRLEDQVEQLVAEMREARDAIEMRGAEARVDGLSRLEEAQRVGREQVERHFSDALDALAEAEAGRIESAAATLASSLAAVTATVEAEVATETEDLDRAFEALTAERAAMEAVVSGCAEQIQLRTEEIDRLQGLVSAHRARQEADTERAAAAALVKDVLRDDRSLAERLNLSDGDVEALLPVLGERLLLPLIGEDEVGPLSEALGDRAVSALWVPAEDPLETLKGRIAVVSSLDRALDHHRSTGGIAVVATTGECIGADGVMRLGRPMRSVSTALSGERAFSAAVQRLEEASAERVALEEQLKQKGESLDAILQNCDENRQTLRGVESDARAREASGLESVRQARAEADGAALQQYRDTRREVSEARQVALGELRLGWRGASVGDSPVIRPILTSYGELVADLERQQEAVAAKLDVAERAVREGRASARSQVQERISVAKADLEALREAHFRATEEHAGALEVRIGIDADRNKESVHLAKASLASEAAETALAELDRRVELLTSRGEDLARERIDLQDSLPGRRRQVQTARATEDERREALQRLRAADDSATAGELEAAARVSQCEVAMAGLAERQLGNVKASEESSARRMAAQERVARGKEGALRLTAARDEAAQLAVSAGEEIGAQEGTRGEAWDRLQRERDRLTALRDGLRESETSLQELSGRREGLGVQTSALEQRAREVKVEVEVLRRRIDERYQVSLSGLMDRIAAGSLTLMPDPAVRSGFEVSGKTVDGVEPLVLSRQRLGDEAVIRDAVAGIESHREALAALGEVHLGALEEFEDLARRHGELDEQRTDLETSVAGIRSAIAKMNRTCRQRFRDAFDRVNDNFQQAYPRLVGGGSARLSLTDEDDLLETGVEIFVQPPGKRLQNLTLLSGGEKAMTAIALLIALFRVKPSPFCVLDEVDAPLDEANGTRFNEMLREMAALSQFVVITHNRKTMEIADTLYGVTMTKPGVSRLVSVKLSSTG